MRTARLLLLFVLIPMCVSAQDVWSVAGVSAICGSYWEPTDEANIMTSTDGVIYSLTKENCVLEEGAYYEYKVVKNQSWDESYPVTNAILTVEETGTYTVMFLFDTSTMQPSAKAEKTGEAEVGEKVWSVVGTLVGGWENDMDMVKIGDGLYGRNILDVASGDYSYKIRANHTWEESYGNGQSDAYICVNADHSVVIVTFNQKNKSVSARESSELRNLLQEITYAEQLYNSDSYALGKDELLTAITAAKDQLSLPDDSDAAAAVTALHAAVDTFIRTNLMIEVKEWQTLMACWQAAGQGAGWTRQWDFSSGTPSVETLPGVTAYSGHVIAIDLSDNGLTGMFPAALLSLPALQSLNLSGNQITGDLGVLTAAYCKQAGVTLALEYVDISANKLSGNIGLFAACCPQLTTLLAQDNCLEDVYPMIPLTVEDLDLKRQTIDRVVDLHLANLGVNDIATKVPSILLYDHENQTFTPDINLLCTTPDNSWGMTMAYQNGQLSIPYVSEQNSYYGESGDTLNVALLHHDGTREGSTFRIKLSFDEGDGNFDGQVNVLDLQTMINYMFEEYANKPYNFTATNLWKDDVINVQDAVCLVNILLDNNSTPASARLPYQGNRLAATYLDSDAIVLIAEGKLIMNAAEPVSSFDIVIATGSEFTMEEALASAGFTCSVRNSGNEIHLVGYSLNGATLAAGQNAIGTLSDGIVLSSMLANAEANEVTTPFGTAPTGINSATSYNHHLKETYKIPLGVKHSLIIDTHGKKYMITEK